MTVGSSDGQISTGVSKGESTGQKNGDDWIVAEVDDKVCDPDSGLNSDFLKI